MTCPEKEPLSVNEKAAKSAEMAQAMGVQACSRQERGIDSSVEAEIDAWVASAKASANFSFTDSASIGCEQISIIANEMNQATDTVSCILSNSSASSELTVNAQNAIRIEANGEGSEIKIDCGEQGLNINQSINIKIIKLDELSEDEQNDIATAVDTAVQQSAKGVQDSLQGRLAMPPSQKQILEQCTKIQNSSYKIQAKENIKKISLNVNAKNDITIIANGGAKIFISGKQCNFNQNIMLDIVAQSIVQNTLKTAFSDTFRTAATMDAETKQKGEVKGVNFKTPTSWAKTIGAIFGFLFLGFVIYLLYQYSQKKGTNTPSPIQNQTPQTPYQTPSYQTPQTPSYQTPPPQTPSYQTPVPQAYQTSYQNPYQTSYQNPY